MHLRPRNRPLCTAAKLLKGLHTRKGERCPQCFLFAKSLSLTPIMAMVGCYYMDAILTALLLLDSVKRS